MGVVDRPAFGPACMLGYVSLFVATNIVTKSLSVGLPLVEIALFRYALAVPVILLIVGARRPGGIRVNSAGLHSVRGALAAVGSLCGYTAMAELPLGDATALFFTSPLLVTAGASFFLRERPDIVRTLCIVTGFVGVLMIARPHFGNPFGVFAGLANAACAASGVLLIRRARHTEDALSLAVTTSVVCSIGLCLPAWAVWTQPSLAELAALSALGIMGGLATALLNLAYQNAPAPVLAGIDYLAVPGSMFAGVLVWGDHPTALALAGATVVVAAGLASLTRRKKEAAARTGLVVPAAGTVAKAAR